MNSILTHIHTRVNCYKIKSNQSYDRTEDHSSGGFGHSSALLLSISNSISFLSITRSRRLSASSFFFLFYETGTSERARGAREEEEVEEA